MHFRGSRIIYIKTWRFFLAGLYFLFIIFFDSCSHNTGTDDHQEFIAPLLKKVDTTKMAEKDKALAYLDSAFNAFRGKGAGDIFSVDSIKLDIYVAKHDFLRALTLADSMILLSEEKNAEELWAQRYARALIFKGSCLYSLKTYDEALHYFTLADQFILTKVKDKCRLAEYGDNIAYLLFAQHRYQLAARYFAANARELLGCGVNSYAMLMKLQRAYDNTGISYFRAGVTDSAQYFYNATLDVISRNESRFPDHFFALNNAKAVVWGNQAEVFLKKGQDSISESLFEKSIEVTRSSDIDYTQSTQERLIQLYLKRNNLQKAGLVLSQMKHSLDSTPGELNLLRWYKVKTAFYDKAKDIPQAYFYQQHYINLRDSIEDRDKKFAARDLSNDFETNRQKAINQTLEKDNRQKNIYLGAALTVSVMFIIIIILVWFNLQKFSRLNREIRKKNTDLQLALTSLEQSHDENTRIIRIVAHDLKNPISAIKNLAYSMLKKEESPAKIESLGLIRTACSDSLTLIKDLLDPPKRQKDANKELIDLTGLVKYCVELLQAKADEKNQVIKIIAEEVSLRINQQKIWRVLSNLINNAIKFSPDKGVIIVELKVKGAMVFLSVQDYGIGIPLRLKDSIFSQEPEVSRIGTAGEESYGLGLSISKAIIEEHNGRIWFESEVGRGSVFYIELPVNPG